jgi:hypothetical protein
MSTQLPTNTNDVCSVGLSLSVTARSKPRAQMKCGACNRPLIRSAFTVGKLDFGPVCFKKLLELGRKAKRVEQSLMPTSDLLDGCYFDQQGAADHAAIVMGVANA